MEFSYRGWESYSYFFSADISQNYLNTCYQKQHLEQSEQKSYENCYPFIYYIEHGQIYYEQAKHSPITIKPILIFYGLVHLVKACILTIDPNYPETTSVLAHGVSTRKRKKQQYQFLHDEVKIQKSGLFPFMAEKMFHMNHLEGTKFSMEQLLEHIPELGSLNERIFGRCVFEKIRLKDGRFQFPPSILDLYHMTENRFIEYYQTKSRTPVLESISNEDGVYLELVTGLSNLIPLKYHLKEQEFVFPLSKNELLGFHELLIHYLLLYNLSMIARYETEWWSELIKMMHNQDYPFIQSFLNVTIEKGPFFIYEFLMERN
ncbi:YaaC family protein [Cytobacillus spongiae]|uniref:YaaC family protein n=1 Tax=Cytobacillus spongiae TaxID=2901381 RepID=UPI001F2D98F4|nr:YaaC family protein [Cytobacillus spongiae]UII55972.1 YaaC family protein [Cytobacillus spongiae]